MVREWFKLKIFGGKEGRRPDFIKFGKELSEQLQHSLQKASKEKDLPSSQDVIRKAFVTAIGGVVGAFDLKKSFASNVEQDFEVRLVAVFKSVVKEFLDRVKKLDIEEMIPDDVQDIINSLSNMSQMSSDEYNKFILRLDAFIYAENNKHKMIRH